MNTISEVHPMSQYDDRNQISNCQLQTENDHIDVIVLLSAVLATIYLVLVTIKYFWRTYFEMQRDEKSARPLPPGTMGWPIIGETVQMVLQGFKFYTTKFEEFGSMYKTHVMGRPTIRLIGAENIKKVLTGENHIVEATWPASVRILLGSGSLSSQTGDNLKQRKAILLKAIGPDALRYFVPEFYRVITHCIDEWCKESHIMGYVKCREMTYKLAAKVIFGIDIEDATSKDMLKDFEILVENLFCLPIKCPGLAFKKATTCRLKLISAIRKLLTLSTKRAPGDDTCVLDVLKNLPETGSLPEDDLIDMLVELLFASHYTTASASCCLLFYLGQRKDVQAKVADDLIENDLMMTSSELTYDQIQKLKYVDHVTKEVLRLKPPVGGGFRKAMKTFEIGEYQVPQNWTVIYSIRETHESSPLFQDRDTFKPERWEDKNINVPDLRFNYLPFGVGARSCPGEKFAKLFLNVFIIELVRRCSWHLDNPDSDMNIFPSPHPKDKLPMTFSYIS